MSEEAKAGTGTAAGTGGGVTLPPGGISGVDTEAHDLDLMLRLIGEKNQPKQEEEEDRGDEGDGEGGDDTDAGTGEGNDDDGSGDGDEESTGDEAGEGDEDGGDGQESEYNAALLEAAKELGFESLEALSEKQLETLKKLVKVNAESGEEDAGEDDEEALTEYERSLLAEDEEEEAGKKDGKDGKEDKPADITPVDEPSTANQFFSALLDGKFKLAYKNDADFYAKLNEAAEKKDVETYEVLQNQRYVERGMKFLLPALQLLVDRKLDAFADIITPALSEYSNVSSQRRVASARDKAIGELESLTVKSGAKPYSGIKQFLTPDQPDKKVVINGTSVPSSPWTRVLKANPEILNIRVPGKDGKTDPTATFISQYKAAMKLSKATSTSTTAPVVKKVAEKMASAGAKAGQRQAQRNAGGKLNSNSSSGTGKQAGQDKKNWAREYAEIGNVTGAASWIGS